MEQDTTEMHLGRIRDVKDLAVLSDEARDVVKEEVILESSGHQVRISWREKSASVSSNSACK